MPELSPEILLSHDEIQQRIAELAADIRRDFPDDLHLVAVLKGAFVFLSDLIRHLSGTGVSRLYGAVQLRERHHQLR